MADTEVIKSKILLKERIKLLIKTRKHLFYQKLARYFQIKSEKTKILPSLYRVYTKEELKLLAWDILEGKVFCDRHINPYSLEIVSKVFQPIYLGGLIGREKELQDCGMIFEYFSEASKNINVSGYPVFMSARFLNKNDTKEVLERHDFYSKNRHNNTIN